MKTEDAIQSLSALAQPSRLDIFRLLVKAGPDGLAAGTIARRLQIAPNTLSAQLAILAQAGLLGSRREGRSIIYSADFSAMARLLVFLTDDCCGGRPEVCAPLFDLTRSCCKPAAKEPTSKEKTR